MDYTHKRVVRRLECEQDDTISYGHNNFSYSS